MTLREIIVKYNKPVRIGLFEEEHMLYGIFAHDLPDVERDLAKHFISKERVRGLREKKSCGHRIDEEKVDSCTTCNLYHWDNDHFNQRIDELLGE